MLFLCRYIKLGNLRLHPVNGTREGKRFSALAGTGATGKQTAVKQALERHWRYDKNWARAASKGKLKVDRSEELTPEPDGKRKKKPNSTSVQESMLVLLFGLRKEDEILSRGKIRQIRKRGEAKKKRRLSNRLFGLKKTSGPGIEENGRGFSTQPTPKQQERKSKYGGGCLP